MTVEQYLMLEIGRLTMEKAALMATIDELRARLAAALVEKDPSSG